MSLSGSASLCARILPMRCELVTQDPLTGGSNLICRLLHALATAPHTPRARPVYYIPIPILWLCILWLLLASRTMNAAIHLCCSCPHHHDYRGWTNWYAKWMGHNANVCRCIWYVFLECRTFLSIIRRCSCAKIDSIEKWKRNNNKNERIKMCIHIIWWWAANF